MSGVWIPDVTLAELMAAVLGIDYSEQDDSGVLERIKRAVELPDPPQTPASTTED